MAQAWSESEAQGDGVGIQTSRWLIEHLLRADTILFATVSAVRNQIASGQLTQLSLAEEVDLKVEFGIAYLAQRTLSPEAEIAIAEITSVMADMAVIQHR